MRDVSKETRREVYNECDVVQDVRNKRCNLHHICFKSDVHKGLVPRHFPVNDRCNLIPLPIKVHRQLHELVERTPAFKNNIDSRIWLANYAYNGELDLL